MKAICRIFILSFVLLRPCVAQEQPKDIPELTDNAALQYWFAFYFMYEPPAGERYVPDFSNWPKRLGELYPTYVQSLETFFIAPDKVPVGMDAKQIDKASHFLYSPRASRKDAGPAAICVLRTRRDDYFAPSRGHVEGYMDGHVEWKPREADKDAQTPPSVAVALSNAKQILLAIMMYEADHPGKVKRKREPSEFVYDELVQGKVPAAEALKQEILKICKKNELAVTQYLHKAAKMTRCDFGLDYSRGLLMLLPHLAKVRSLARNVVAYGKLLEAEGNPSGAAEVYCDVIAMGPQVAQDQLLVSALVGIAVQKIGSNALRCLLAHDPPAEVCEAVLARLSELPDPYIQIGPRLPFEAMLLKPMLFAAFAKESHPAMAEADKEAIRKMIIGENASALPQIDLNDESKMKRILSAFFEEYLAKVEMAAEIMGEPYPSAAITLREMENEVKDSVNFLIKMMMPTVFRLPAQQAAAQTGMYATRILAAAALHKARTGQYPAAIDDLKPYFPKGIPRDPMGDKDFSYRLDDGKPGLESVGPPLGIGERAGEGDYFFSFAQLLRKENSGRKWEGR